MQHTLFRIDFFRIDPSIALSLFLVLGVLGCARGGEEDSRGRGPNTSDSGISDASEEDGARTIPRPDADPDGDSGACVSVGARAERRVRPVDIVWVIDSSPSMDEEAALVRRHMNEFSTFMAGRSIDYHVVLITKSAYASVPPPLGSDTARFRHVDHHVTSHGALRSIVDTFPQYADMLRPDARLHLVAVSDDDSRPFYFPPGEREFPDASTFHEEFHPLIDRRWYTLHAIVSPPGSTHRGDDGVEPGCEGPYGAAAANGAEYHQLAEWTSGIRFSICAPDWTPLFEELARAVVDQTLLPCRYTIPPPPDGMMLDLDRINVQIDRGGEREIIPRSSMEFSCDDAEWELEGDEIVLCPEACEQVMSEVEAEIDVLFGCDTILY